MSTEPATNPSLSGPSTTAAGEKPPLTSEAVSGVEAVAPPTSTEVAKPITASSSPEVKAAAQDIKSGTEDKPSEPAVAFADPEKTTIPPPSLVARLASELPTIVKEAEHNEIWGVVLADEEHVPTSIVLEKFLRANAKDVAKAKAQLVQALKWRKEVDPRKLLDEVEFDRSKFGNVGFVTVYPKTEAHAKEIVTWNVYGAVKDISATFGDVEEFIKWRSALMELSVKELDLASATVPIPADGVDPYRMIQVHDYLNVSFLRAPPAVRAASKKVVDTFSMAYPELLSEKFFVNVPLIMGWMFTAMKVFLSPETIKKFHPLSYGSSLAGELKALGPELPTPYGGKGKDITEGMTVKYAAGSEVAVSEEVAASGEKA